MSAVSHATARKDVQKMLAAWNGGIMASSRTPRR